MSGAYYNEIDQFAAAWLRELIKVGLIAPGQVDERSIEEVKPEDLRGFTQCHFFAGIGVWSYALRAAGWADDSPVWTGSCPCQSFSASGQRCGFSDKRHLWPAWFRLIRERRPVTVFGEQVASKDGYAWLDLVQTDMEAAGYAIGATDICAAGFGAPHIRQRLYFVAHAQCQPGRAEHEHEPGRGHPPEQEHGAEFRRGGAVNLLANTESDNRRAQLQAIRTQRRRAGSSGDRITGSVADAGDSERGWRAQPERDQQRQLLHPANRGRAGELGDAIITRLERHAGNGDHGNKPGWHTPAEDRSASETSEPGPTNGFWRYAEWLACRDGKSRPVESGTFPLVNGATNRVGRLRGYGNAINAEVAKAFIEAYMSIYQQ